MPWLPFLRKNRKRSKRSKALIINQRKMVKTVEALDFTFEFHTSPHLLLRIVIAVEVQQWLRPGCAVCGWWERRGGWWLVRGAGRAGRPVHAGRETSQQRRSAGQASEEPAGEYAADTGPRAGGDGESSTTTRSVGLQGSV